MTFNLKNLIDKESEKETEKEVKIMDKASNYIQGKIIKISNEGGWGFISSKEVPFTRIFFHWTSLEQDTLNFTELKRGMEVEFILVEKEGRGFSAIKISVLEDNVEEKE